MKILSRLAPRLSIDIERRADARWDLVSHDPVFNAQTRADPLRNLKVTPRWFAETAAAVQRVNQAAENFPVPLLLLMGEADQTVPPQASKNFIQKMAFPDKELHEYPGAYTNLLSDTVYEDVLADIDRWLDRHLPGPGQAQGSPRVLSRT